MIRKIGPHRRMSVATTTKTLTGKSMTIVEEGMIRVPPEHDLNELGRYKIELNFFIIDKVYRLSF